MPLILMRIIWFGLLMLGVLWPSRFLGPLDGVPLDRPFEAVLIGLALPWLFWLGRDACRLTGFRVLVIALLAWKVVTFQAATQQGLCATFRAPSALSGSAATMRIDEPLGFLRSWDLRGDWRAAEPNCTAIISRPLASTEDFPAWFVNITDQMMGRRDFVMHVRGAAIGEDGRATAVDVSVPLGSAAWTFDPVVDGQPVLRQGLVMTASPSALDRLLAPWAWLIAPALCLMLIAMLLRAAIAPMLEESAAIAWIGIATALAIALGLAPMGTLQRFAGAMCLGAAAVRVRAEDRHTTATAAWLVGAPWLAFFAASSIGLIGRVTAYSVDDWLAYQVAGYRIYMNGHWLEAGTPAFDFQPLYRWITGALHLVFGDSSVGELYWDASWLLFGALLAFRLASSASGFRSGIFAAALTLMTLTVATPWYIIGRGISEISAAGFGFAAIWCLMMAAHRSWWVIPAALFAILMFYARLNHLLWAPCLAVMLLPQELGADFANLRVALARVRWTAVGSYLALFGAGIILFMVRTWYFTGQFSLFHGTALVHNDTGLRPWHFIDAEVWSKIGHSLLGLTFMNEPPRFDARAAIVLIGLVAAVAALLQVPVVRRVPARLALVTLAGAAGALFAHSHGYPGRFTIHLIPLASALTVIGASVLLRASRKPAPLGMVAL